MSPHSEFKPTAVEDIVIERLRQIQGEGRSPAGDVGREAELLQAAYAYILSAHWQRVGSPLQGVPPSWPWGGEHWKPTTPRRDLVKAGALIAAAIDAIDLGEQS